MSERTNEEATTAHHESRIEEQITRSQLGVISDIHSNVDALDAALNLLAARGIETAVVLGDLFTYGCSPLEVLDRLDQTTVELWFVRGNHDLLYETNSADYFETLPDWIRESVEWNRRALAGRMLPTTVNSIAAARILFAHCNPFPFGDWTYLDREDEIVRAAKVLRENGFCAGIFGHTHRRRASIVSREDRLVDRNDTAITLSLGGGEIPIVNPGSVGQPRGTRASMLVVSMKANAMTLEFEDIQYDVSRHVATILASDLSDATKARLIRFFER